EGVFIGVAGSAVIAAINGGPGWWIVVLAGTVGNLTDSVLGAALERQGYLSNNAVNFFNTLVAALIGALLTIVVPPSSPLPRHNTSSRWPSHQTIWPPQPSPA